jgi:hypothetical protein
VDLAHVFAKVTVTVNDLGYPQKVQGGTHWLADDPLVLKRPDLFTADCRYGLAWSGEPPAVLMLPPGEEDPVMTAKVRSRSQAERSRVAG